MIMATKEERGESPPSVELTRAVCVMGEMPHVRTLEVTGWGNFIAHGPGYVAKLGRSL